MALYHLPFYACVKVLCVKRQQSKSRALERSVKHVFFFLKEECIFFSFKALQTSSVWTSSTVLSPIQHFWDELEYDKGLIVQHHCLTSLMLLLAGCDRNCGRLLQRRSCHSSILTLFQKLPAVMGQCSFWISHTPLTIYCSLPSLCVCLCEHCAASSVFVCLVLLTGVHG